MIGSLQSQVELEFCVNAQTGKTVLSRRKTGGLCHISKPYWDEAVLGVQLVNPTAGLFSGDRLHMRVAVNHGAKVALTSPSATRFHTMPEGRAEVLQEFFIGENSWLDSWPEFLLPQRDSNTCQITKIHLKKNAEMVFLDSLAPGRVAHGDAYGFRCLDTRLKIFREGKLLVKERSLLKPSKGLWPLQHPKWDMCFYGALWIVTTSEIDLKQLENYANIEEANYEVGASKITDGIYALRFIASDSITLKALIVQTRNKLKEVLPLLGMDFRKL